MKLGFVGLGRMGSHMIARLLKQGVNQSEVARRIGVHRQTVIRWVRQLAVAGRAGLKKAAGPDANPNLAQRNSGKSRRSSSAVRKRWDMPPDCGPRCGCAT